MDLFELETDDLESLEELKQLLRKEQEIPDMFIGDFNVEPNHEEYPINSFYKKSGIVYINTTSGWKKFLQDGLAGKSYPSGGGVGLNELNRVLDDRLANFSTSGSSFSGTIDSASVLTSGTYINTSAANLSGVLEDFDNVISKKILFGEYKTNDVYEEAYLYVGCASLDGKWYIKRVEEVGEDIFLRYANISNNPTVTTYSNAINTRDLLVYDLIQNITV